MNRSVDPLDQLLGTNQALAALKARARQLLDATRRARRCPPVLLQGETGTGKNLLARALHQASGRSEGPFVHVQCNAIPEALAETLLFGHERGAFTGADRPRSGYFRTAHHGTILLDEIGTLSEAIQARLLQVIDEGLVPVVGLPTAVPVDVWVICATNVDLTVAARERRFRADLLSRLTVRFTLPPLRDRPSDIIPLAEKFVSQACADFSLPPKKLSPAARTRLEQALWADNARGLRNMVENAVIFTPGAVIGAEHLEGYDLTSSATASGPPPVRMPSAVSSPGNLRDSYLDVLEQTGWNISRSAHRLGITRNTLRARIARWDLRELAAQRGSPQAGATRDLPNAGLPDTERVYPAGAGGLGEAEHVEDDRAVPVEMAGPDTRAVAREIRWERRWLGFLRFGLALSDADDAMVRARQYLDLALEKVRQFGGQVVSSGRRASTPRSGSTPSRAPRSGRARRHWRSRSRQRELTRTRPVPRYGVSCFTRCHAWSAHTGLCQGSTAMLDAGPPT